MRPIWVEQDNGSDVGSGGGEGYEEEDGGFRAGLGMANGGFQSRGLSRDQ